MIKPGSPAGYSSCLWGYSARSRHTLGDRRLAARTLTDDCDSEITDTHITTFEVLTAVTLCRWGSRSLLVDTTHWLHLHVRFIAKTNANPFETSRNYSPDDKPSRARRHEYMTSTWLDGFQLWIIYLPDVRGQGGTNTANGPASVLNIIFLLIKHIK